MGSKLISVGETVSEKLDDMRDRVGKLESRDISYNEAIIMLLDRQSIMGLWDSHMSTLRQMVAVYMPRDLDGGMTEKSMEIMSITSRLNDEFKAAYLKVQ